LYDPPIQSSEVGAPWLETTEYRGVSGGSIYGVDGQSLLPPLPQGPPPQTLHESETEGLLGNDPNRISYAPAMPPPMTGASFRSMMSGMTGEPAYSQAPSMEQETDVGNRLSTVVSPFEDEEEAAAPTSFEQGAFSRHEGDTGTS
jgi:hypothetical protein